MGENKEGRSGATIDIVIADGLGYKAETGSICFAAVVDGASTFIDDCFPAYIAALATAALDQSCLEVDAGRGAIAAIVTADNAGKSRACTSFGAASTTASSALVIACCDGAAVGVDSKAIEALDKANLLICSVKTTGAAWFRFTGGDEGQTTNVGGQDCGSNSSSERGHGKLHCGGSFRFG